MDESLPLLPYLYDELSPDEAAELERRLADDPALRREYEALRATKEHLDTHRAAHPSPEPDEAVVDAVVDAAAAAARDSDAARTSGATPQPAAPAARADRPPQDPPQRSARRLQGVSAVLALLLVAGVGWWQWTAPAGPSPEEAATPTARAPDRATPSAPAPDRRDVARSARLPDWDEGDEVVRLHRRIEVIESRSAPSQWNESLQPVRASPGR
jgi:anti-sigma factor RsiW